MQPTVAEWLSGKDILITGATGFLGKVLVEKLLRSCPRIGRLYIIIRTKKGTDPKERMKEYAKNELFGKLLEENPNAFDKVIAIPGDISALDCGLSKENQQILRENISVVFHSAASVRFDECLSDALKLNTRGTHELIKIAKGMKKLEVFQYVSTTYCNANVEGKIQEKVYPSHLDWKALLQLLDKDDDVLDYLLNKVMSNHPNSYTLSKSLAENVVLEAGKDIPAVILRPSVVTPMAWEPLPGWTDNLNGPMGVNVGVSKGVLRTFRCSPTAVLDLVPVDISVNGIISAAWSKRFDDDGELKVFNQTYGDQVPVTFQDLSNIRTEVNGTYPLENYFWYPFIILTNNTYYYHFLFYFLQFIPALFQDLLLTLFGHKRTLLRLNVKIYNAGRELSNFSDKPFKFVNSNYRSIASKMHANDRKAFIVHHDANIHKVDPMEIIMDYQKGVKKYIFHEKEEDLSKYRAMHKRLYYIHRAMKMVFLGFVFWIPVMWACGYQRS